MSIGRRVVLGCCRWSTACGVVLIWAAPVVLIIFALLLPANAQYWGNSWGGRQQQSQQPYNPYGGYGGYGADRPWDQRGYRPPERAPSPPPRVRESEKGRPQDFSPPPPGPAARGGTGQIAGDGGAPPHR